MDIDHIKGLVELMVATTRAGSRFAKAINHAARRQALGTAMMSVSPTSAQHFGGGPGFGASAAAPRRLVRPWEAAK